MKKLTLIFFFLTAATLFSFAQDTEAPDYALNAETEKYEYKTVLDFPGVSAIDLFKGLKEDLPSKDVITYEEEGKKLVLRFWHQASAFKFFHVSYIFEFKDEKLRWTANDIHYLFKKTAMSKPVLVEDLEGKHLKYSLKKINEFLEEARTALIKDLKKKPEGESGDDW